MGHIPHLYLPPPWEGDEIPVNSDQANHVSKVLRVDSTPVTYTNGEGVAGKGTYRSGLVVRGGEEVVARPTELVVAVAPPRNRDRQRFLVEKVAELGVERLVWLETRYGATRFPSKAKSEAWATSALEQSRGSWRLKIDEGLTGWNDLEPPVVVCEFGGGDGPSPVRTVAIGPEGGWAPDEIPPGLPTFGLGPTLLRVETAAVSAVVRLT